MIKESCLEKSIMEFSENPSQKIYNNVLLAIVKDAGNEELIHVPITINKDTNGEFTVKYEMVQGSDNRYYYIICTEIKELDGLGYESSVVMNLYDILTISSNNSEAGGICINPWSVKDCIIPNEYIEGLVK